MRSPTATGSALTVMSTLTPCLWKQEMPALMGCADLSLKYAPEASQQFDITKGKNATGMRMIIDATDLLFRGRVTGFGLMSSDSDFMRIAMPIR